MEIYIHSRLESKLLKIINLRMFHKRELNWISNERMNKHMKTAEKLNLHEFYDLMVVISQVINLTLQTTFYSLS